MTDTILICTVGGSHEPIVTAIRDLKPDFVCFVCTGRDPATGQPGSDRQITGAGAVIKARYADERATLPNIPTQVELASEQFEVVTVLADDLAGAVETIEAAVASLRARFPDAKMIADYTGGTKTMTAALVTAALDREIDLQVVTGPRADLVKVRSGMQRRRAASVQSLRLWRGVEICLKSWERYAYDEAVLGLEALEPSPE